MWIWQWKCCELLWELIPSRLFPERNKFKIICPNCNQPVKREWVKIPNPVDKEHY